MDLTNYKLSVVVPAYNEVHTIEDVLRRIDRTPLVKEIIVVDDGSSDGTGERLEGLVRSRQIPCLRVVRHQVNQGKGAALRTGMAAVEGEVVIVQDADLEYDPKDYDILLEPILSDKADVVFGSRFLSGPHRVLFFWHYVGNRLLTLLSNAFTNLNLTDMETGYKAFRTDIVRRLSIEENRFGFEPEITAKVARLGCRIYEVPISYHGRSYDEGKKITWKDGVAALYCIVKYNVLSPVWARATGRSLSEQNAGVRAPRLGDAP